jgi:YfiH family protein
VTPSLQSALLTRAGFRHGFSTRSGGVSLAPFDSLNLARNVGDGTDAVKENHRRFAAIVGYQPERLYEVSQVHGAKIELVDPREDPLSFRAREADALWTQERNVAVAIRVADCVPVLVGDPVTGAAMAIHAGWRGVTAGVVPQSLLSLLKQARARAGDLLCAIGPHIGPKAFEVGDDVARQIASAAPDDARVVMGKGPRPRVNLERAVVSQLLAAGVAPANIERVPGCTFSEPARFYSFRRDGARSGRHLAAIVAGC